MYRSIVSVIGDIIMNHLLLRIAAAALAASQPNI
jgi:hypothetical protein